MIIKAGGFYHINMLLISQNTDLRRDINRCLLNDAQWGDSARRINPIQSMA